MANWISYKGPFGQKWSATQPWHTCGKLCQTVYVRQRGKPKPSTHRQLCGRRSLFSRQMELHIRATSQESPPGRRHQGESDPSCLGCARAICCHISQTNCSYCRRIVHRKCTGLTSIQQKNPQGLMCYFYQGGWHQDIMSDFSHSHPMMYCSQQKDL